MTPITAPLLRVEGLTCVFRGRDWRARDEVRAVDDVSFNLAAGKTLALVGESGCGKSTLSRILVRLVKPSSGRAMFDGVELLTARGAVLRRLRRQIQMIFQDPGGSLNPRFSIAALLEEPLVIHRIGSSGCERRALCAALLEQVGLSAGMLERSAHELSGGQRQRVAIARALACGPRLLICDEPTSALDVSVQAQILNLLLELRERLGLTCLFVSHNLAVVGQMADDIAVMRAGRIVEIGPAQQVLGAPQHEYTRTLLGSVLE